MMQNLQLEAKSDEGNPILSKVSCDFEVNENYNVKNVSLDSSGLIMGDVDIEKLVKNTTFMIQYELFIFCHFVVLGRILMKME